MPVTANSFAAPADLNNFLVGSGGGPVNTDRAQQVLNQVTALIQGWTGQNIFAVANDVVTVDPVSDGYVLLPELPITAVSLVEVFDCRTSTWTTLDPSYYRWNRRGKLYLVKVPDFWPWQLDSVRVTYSHGFSTIPTDLQGLCIDLAAQEIANPYRAQKMQTGGVMMQFASARGTDGLKDSDLRILGKYTIEEVS